MSLTCTYNELLGILKKLTCTHLSKVNLVSFFCGSFHDNIKVCSFFTSLLHMVPLLSLVASADEGILILVPFPLSV